MPGVSDLVAQVVVAEIGVDTTRRSTRVRKSAQWLKTTLVTAAWSAVRVKKTYLHAQFLRIKARRGPKKAILAIGASMLTAAYCMLRDGVEYRDLGPAYLDRRPRTKTINRLLRRLHDLGYELAPAPTA
jgi:hypothetical protein